MMRRRVLFQATAFLALAVPVACGLDPVTALDGAIPLPGADASVEGDASTTTPGRDAGTTVDEPDASQATDAATSPTDAGGDADIPATCNTSSTECSGALTAAGWQPVVVPLTNKTCPEGTSPVDLIMDPEAKASACTCSTPKIKEPSCTSQPSYSGTVGTDCTTAQPGSTYIPTGACLLMATAGNLAPFGTYQTIEASGARSCNSDPIANKKAVKAKELRLCLPAAECTERTCTTADSNAAKICVAKAGRQSCPNGFSKLLNFAAEDVTVACGPCACHVAGECGTATLRYFSDAQCKNESAHRVADGKCNALQGSTAAPKAYRYEANPNFHAEMDQLSQPSVDLDGDSVQTVCCR